LQFNPLGSFDLSPSSLLVCVVFAIKVWQVQIDIREIRLAFPGMSSTQEAIPTRGKTITNELLTIMDTPPQTHLTHTSSLTKWLVGGWVVIRCQMRAGRTRA